MAESQTPQEQQGSATVEGAAEVGKSGPGATLRAAREASGQGAADIARSLCLELRLVEAIEDDRYEAFGAAVFARGHVRRYAQALELDANALLRSWDERYATAPPPAVPDPKVAPVADHNGGVPAPLLIGLLLLVLAGGAAFVWWWLHPPAADASAPPVAAAPPTPRSDTPTATSISPSSAASSPEQAQPAQSRLDAALDAATDTIEQTAREQAPSVEEGVGALTERAVVALPPPAADDAAPVALAQEAVSEEPAQTDIAQAVAAAGPAPVGSGSEVAVRFIFDDACWVNVRDAAGKTLMLGLREPGTVNDRSGVPPINVTLGRYPGVRIEVDGQPFSVPTSAIDGAIARFEIPAP